jgi:hypothetical protein
MSVTEFIICEAFLAALLVLLVTNMILMYREEKKYRERQADITPPWLRKK